jgi:hypothetical protein
MNINNNEISTPAKDSNSLAVQQTTTQKMGVALNQRPITNSSLKDGHSSDLQHSDDVVKEPGWTLENILDRYKFVGSYPIPTSLAPGSVIQRFRVPMDLTLNNVTTLAPFEAFKYWSGHVEINAQLAASPGVQGCLAMVYVPLTSSQFIESNILTNFSSMTINQTCYLFPNTNTASNMIIPFNTPYSMLDLTNPPEQTSPRDNLGFLYLIVFNRFELSANTSDDTHVSLFVNFHDSKFKVPRLNGTSGRIIRSRAESEDQARKEPSSGSASVIKKIADVILPKNVITDGFKTVATLFGLDKPTVCDDTPPVKVKSTQFMNNCNGIDHIDKMSLYPQAVSLVSPKSFATITDEMEFRYLFSKFSYLGTFSISVDDPVGKVVGSFPLSPTPVPLAYKPGSTTSVAPISRIPLLQYLVIPFEFWNGSLNYRMQVVSTMMQSCKLFVGLNYGVYLPSTTTNLNEISSQYGQIIEINQGSNTFDIKAEFIAQTPMLHVASSNVPSEYDTMGYVNIAVLNKLISGYGSPGSIHVNVFLAGGDNFNVNTMTTSKNYVPVTKVLEASTITRVEKLYTEMSEDEQDFEVVKVFATKKIPRKSVAQSAAQPIITPMSEVDRTQEPEATAPSSGSDTRMTTAQPYIQSVRHLLRKYQMYTSLPIIDPNTPGGSVYKIPLTRIFHRSNTISFSTYNPAASEIAPNLGNFTHFQKIYRQFNGSLSFKIMCRLNMEFSVFYSPPIYNINKNSDSSPPLEMVARSIYNFDGVNPVSGYTPIDQTGIPYMTRLPVAYVNAPNRTAEFNIPFTSRFHSLLSSQGPFAENPLTNSELISLGDLFVVAHKPINNAAVQDYPIIDILQRATAFDVYFCLGDDARLGNLFNVPYVSSRYPIHEGALGLPYSPDDLETTAIVTNTLSIFP